ncbi:MAG: ABC transporter substrate-binding protein [Planctomycetota bacterium]
MKNPIRFRSAFVGAVAVALLTAACGGTEETAAPEPAPAPAPADTADAAEADVDDADETGPTECVPADPAVPVSFQLNWTAGGYNSGFALALQEGWYRDVGLNVTIVKGPGSGTTAQLVATGQAALAYADASAVMQTIAQGADVTVLSTMYQSSPNAINSLAGSGIESIADLKGKNLGEPTGGSGTPLLPLLFEANGLTLDDVNRVPMPNQSLVPALVSGQVDAIVGSTEGFNLILEEQGYEVIVLPYADWGVPTVSTSIFASNSFLETNANTVRCFIQASLKGWDEAIKDPDGAIEALVTTFPTDTEPTLNRRQLDSAISLFCTGGAKFVGKAEPEHWEQSVVIAQDYFDLSKDVPATAYYSYDYLPAELPTSCPLS